MLTLDRCVLWRPIDYMSNSTQPGAMARTEIIQYDRVVRAAAGKKTILQAHVAAVALRCRSMILTPYADGRQVRAMATKQTRCVLSECPL